MTAKQAGLDSLERNLDYFSRHFPQERVYLHFDNTSYYKGEHIYYKASVVRGDDFRPTPLSRILYVELVSPEGWPVEKQRLIIWNGHAHGSFLLKDSLNSGFYEVRAYTSWMLNFAQGYEHAWQSFRTKDFRQTVGERFDACLRSNAGIFSRVFPIYEKVNSGAYSRQEITTMPKMTSDLSDGDKEGLTVDFYPEGGNLIRGIPTRLAFEAHNEQGELLNVKGDLLKGDRVIGTFGSFYGGRGMLNVTSESDGDSAGEDLSEDLKFRVRYLDKDYRFSLPAVRSKGFGICVLQRDTTLAVTVRRNQQTEGDSLGLVVLCRGRVCQYRLLDLSRELRADVTFGFSELMTGVNVFMVYNARGKVVTQREVFVNRHDMDNLRIGVIHNRKSTGKTTLAAVPYEKTEVGLQLKDSLGREVPMSTIVSVSVTDGDCRDKTFASETNVLTEMLLSSEIRGFVPYANYYFEKDDAAHRQALDLLMMVQGWTRYDFAQMSHPRSFSPMFKIEKGLSLMGRVLRRSDENRANWGRLKKEVWLDVEIDPTDTIVDGEQQTSGGGKFSFNIPEFYGRGYAFLMLNRRSRDVIGEESAGIGGHIAQSRGPRPDVLESRLAISLEDVFPPLAKPYTYYETCFPRDTVASAGSLRYEPAEDAFRMAPVLVKARRQWSKFDLGKPSLVIDVKDMMTYLSEVRGSLQEFDLTGGKVTYGNLQFENGEKTDAEGIMYNYLIGISQVATLLGVSGRMDLYINGHKLTMGCSLDGDHFRNGFGNWRLLPDGMEFVPPSVNIQRMALYAQFDNRTLMYQRGKYKERIQTGSHDTPTTLRVNLISDNNYIPGAMNLEFLGKRMIINGISQPDEFYTPDYSRKALPQETDFRRTVYWNPDVKTDNHGRAKVEFYNNGMSRTLQVSAEGIANGGTLVVGE